MIAGILSMLSAIPAVAAPGVNPAISFFISEYRVDGVHSLPRLSVEEAVYPFLGPERTVGDIEKARAALEKAYHDAGFQTVSVEIPRQSVN